MGGTASTRRQRPREVAHALLDAVLRDRRALDEALADSAGFAGLDMRDRALVRHLTATTLRRLGQIDALLAGSSNAPCRTARLRRATRSGSAPPTSCSCARRRTRRSTRRWAFCARPRRAAIADSPTPFSAASRARAAHCRGSKTRRGSTRLTGSGGAGWTRTAPKRRARWPRSHLAEPPLDITAASEPDAWARRLEAEILPTGSLRRAPAPVETLPGFREGGWWVQDAAAALPARVLLAGLDDPEVADLCAAPGGKTAQLASAGARVTALDISPGRLERLEENLARLRLTAKLVEADLLRWTPAAPFDAVLLDAPCSGTGTIRRHPDIARNKTADDVARMAALQRALLDAAAKAVRPGGRLVYAVCSLQPEEGPEAVDAFLAASSDFRRLPVKAGEIAGTEDFLTPEGDLRTLPCHLAGLGGIDGFHVSRLERRSGATVPA